MVKVPVMTTQPQLSGWLPSDPVFQEPEAEKMEGPVSPSWDHSVAHDWALGTSLAIPRAPRHSQGAHLESLAHPSLAFADGTEPE